jgi:hypothetical protein
MDRVIFQSICNNPNPLTIISYFPPPVLRTTSWLLEYLRNGLKLQASGFCMRGIKKYPDCHDKKDSNINHVFIHRIVHFRLFVCNNTVS